MSEEEKKAIEILNKNILVDECWKNHDIDQIFKETHIWALKIVLNLIEKQQKEIENSVSKDIIREKINERQFELQQEYKDFEDDVRLNTLQEIYYLNEEKLIDE